MNNSKNSKDNSSIPTNSINVPNPQNRTFFNPETSKINKDLLFFKNDVLKDLRRLEEKFNIKIAEQSLINSEQYEMFDKKLNDLSNRIEQVHSLILDNNDYTDKIKNFMKFKTKAEDNFNRINSRIGTFQKEYKDYVNGVEKLINENLKYPGVIGRNAKFMNFRYFIDFTIRGFKDVNEFKEEIREFDFNEFRKKVNSDISDFRFAISDNYKNSVRLIGNTFKEFDIKLADLIKKNNDNMKENEDKFETLKNSINNYFAEYQTKFDTLEKNINDRYTEQLNEIEKIKNMKNEFYYEMNNFKSYLEEQKKEQEKEKEKEKEKENNYNYNLNDENQENDNKDLIIQDNKDPQFRFNSRNINYKTILSGDKRKLLIELLNNINLIDEYQKSEEKNYMESLNNKRISSLYFERSKSFENSQKNLIDENINDLKNSHDDIKNLYDKKKLENNNNNNNNIIRSNYSISNIKNIKIKKVILPENLNKLYMNHTAKSLISENKGIRILQNNISSALSKKNIDINENMNGKNTFNIPKINKNKEVKNKSIKVAYSDRTEEKKQDLDKNKNIMSTLLIVKAKSKNKIMNKIGNQKRRTKHSWSYDNEKNLKDEQAQIGFRKTFNVKNKIRELILKNSKNFKISRKVEL